ncbi:MAG: zinc ribbon domain-containing protein [Myxococcota bacterium]|nr:zinc ribbon domain-containing protein [Myxococcota bacterium]
MVKLKWRIDDQNVVTLDSRLSGRDIVKYNDRILFNKINWKIRRDINFHLDDGTFAQLVIKLSYLMIPTFELRVDGNLVLPTGQENQKRICKKCDSVAQPRDRFCESCGTALPSAEDIERKSNVTSATTTIFVLAVLFMIFGLIMFGIQYNETKKVLKQLEGLEANATIPQPINGQTYTAGELRKVIAWEPWGILTVNIVLAVIMTGLGIWSRRSPLPAILTAAAVYVVVITGNAIADPRTIGQGIFIKIIVIAALVNGIKGALDSRKDNA